MGEYTITVPDLIKKLNDATKAYDEGNPIMTDKEWDDLYFALLNFENQTGTIFPDSPTQKVNYEVVNKLEKVEHNHPMLSLDKTKSIDEVNNMFNDILLRPIVMCKMDGLTCSLHYVNGELVGAETRGNGYVGENILHNARHIKSIPQHVDTTDELIIDGEIICKYDDFIPFAEEYKNPRNFAAGSIRLLNSKISAARKLTFVAWDLVNSGEEFDNDFPLLTDRFNLLKLLGFKVVPYVMIEDWVDENVISLIKTQAYYNNYPIDGVVFKYNDVVYGRSLGSTDHHFKNAIAYKFYDELYETNLKNIDWTMGRTGSLTPVAVFEPIDIDGSMVERASLHNLDIMEEVLGKPYVGQVLRVFKANQIIPQIESADKPEDGKEYEFIPVAETCPICGSRLTVSLTGTSRQLVCENPQCQGKLINRLDHFCGKKGLDIKGLSKATLEKLINWEWVASFTDIFKLSDYKEEWIKKPGFGEKSVNNILNAIEAARSVNLDTFICSLGIPLIGKTASKELAKHISSYEEFREKVKSKFDFSEYEDFAENKTLAIWNFDYSDADATYQYLLVAENRATAQNNTTKLEGQNIVITGKLTHYKNRNELQEIIEQNGGKVSSSVSKNTTLLINNDTTSSSAKNVSAKKLGVKIVSEDDFIAHYLT